MTENTDEIGKIQGINACLGTTSQELFLNSFLLSVVTLIPSAMCIGACVVSV